MEEKMTSKRRAELRGEANGLDPLFQVGKSGVTDAVIAQTLDVFNTHELIKIKVLLDSAPEKPREIADKLAAATDSQVVQVIGGSMIFFKENPELHEEKKTAKKVTVKKSGTGKGAKDFKKIYNARAKKEEERKAAEQRRSYSRYGKSGSGRFAK